MEELIKEKVIIVSVNDEIDNQIFSYRINEIVNLAEACNFEVVDTIIQNLDHPNSKTFVGKGKLDEVKMSLNAYNVETVIFEDELTPAQIANLEQILNCEIIDRNMLILMIFEQRAKTKEAVLQVKIAKLKYMLPRLIGSRDYMSRTGGGASGGMGARRGGGETKLELDHRHIERQIYKAQSELAEVVKNRSQSRKSRKNNNTKVVAFVGYTNVGKSSTINNLIEMHSDDLEKQVFVKDMLFATLETTTRRIKTKNNHEFLITDTVGFVSNLPHHLVESFKSTLEEITDADLIIHVIDASSPFLELQTKTTLDVLNEIGVKDIPIINVYNKVDRVNDFVLQTIDNTDSLFTSAISLAGYDELLNTIEKKLFGDYISCELLIPYTKGEILNTIMNNSVVDIVEYLDNGIYIKATVSTYLYNLYKEYKTN
jgi:GTP-binding protein HflX